MKKKSSIRHRIICSVRDKGKQIQYTLFTFSEGTILIKGLTYLVAWPLILSSLSREWWWTRKKMEGFTVFQQFDLILGFLVNFWCSCSSRVSKCPLSLPIYNDLRSLCLDLYVSVYDANLLVLFYDPLSISYKLHLHLITCLFHNVFRKTPL